MVSGVGLQPRGHPRLFPTSATALTVSVSAFTVLPTLSYHIPRSDVHSLSLLCLHHPLPYDSSFPWSSVYILNPALSVTPLLLSLTLPNSDQSVAHSFTLSIIFPSVSLCHQTASSSASLFLAHPVRLNATQSRRPCRRRSSDQ